MIDRNRRISRCLATALTAAAFALALPAGALAEPRDRGVRHADGHFEQVRHRDERRHDRFERRHDRHERRHFRRGHGPRFAPPPRRPYPVHVHGASCRHQQSRYGYYCRPCGHRFDQLGGLHHHVHLVHRVPFWKLPFVIFAKAMGHYYYG